jgi:drug/metabolite transporter (DMT)-like permease
VTGLRKYAFALGPLAAAALWGGMFVVSKWSFDMVPPVTMAFFRVALGGLALWIGLGLLGDARRGIDRADWPAFAGLGFWVTLTLSTQFLGTDLTNASQGSLLTVLVPVFAVVLGALVHGEAVTATNAAGTATAAAGTAIVVVGQYDLSAVATGSAAGVALLVVSSVGWAGYTVWGLPVVRKYSALTAATYSALAAMPMLAVLAAGELLVLGRGVGSIPLSAASSFAILYLGVAATAAAWYLWYKGLEYVPAGSVAVFYFLQPVVGTALGAALLDERIGPGFLAGSIVIGIGVWLVSRERASEPTATPENA